MKRWRIGALAALVAVVAAVGFATALEPKLNEGAPTSGPSAAMAAAATPESPSPDAAAARDSSIKADEEELLARNLLEEHQAVYKHLDGVTVSMGTTPNDEQAVAYYTDAEILISPTHEASIEDILAHEIWHVIDWRDNGVLDWGEQIPPSNASDYVK